MLNAVSPASAPATPRTHRTLFLTEPLRIAAASQVSNDYQLRESGIALQNVETERWNARVGELLGAVSGRPANSDPRGWWQWWVEHLDVQAPGRKQVVIVDEEDVYVPPVEIIPVASCLAAGTPVWTDTGPLPVEQVQVGDCVLSKDVETGELAYRPVVLTTVRQAPRHVRIQVDGEVIQLTGGHPVWVSGAGWTKARDLKPGTPLHTAAGMLRVEAVEAVGADAAYNLVVAGTHTYFFGRNRLLSHDTTIARLTNAAVPGLLLCPNQPVSPK